MSLRDFFRVSEREAPDHGGPLYFNQRLLGGVPLRSQALPTLTQEEVDEVPIRPVARVDLFDLSIPEKLEEYTLIRHRIANGWYVEKYVERHFNPEKQHMLVYLEWYQLYGDVPTHLQSDPSRPRLPEEGALP